jgi:putative transposase
MILTFKVKHGRDFTPELAQARKVAEHAIQHRSISSADVKHIGLKAVIANQILRKYSRNKTLKKVRNVKLTVPAQSVKVEDTTLKILCLKLTLPIYFNQSFEKVNQIELDDTFAYVSVSYNEPPEYQPQAVIGVDRNSTKHVLVASNLTTGKVLKLGKLCQHVHRKYRDIRRRLQKVGELGLLKRIKDRESKIIRNINHHISKRLVGEALETRSVIVLEYLKGIRQTARCRRKQRYSLNSWSFHQLAGMIVYKAKKLGVPLAYVEPQYTSQRCSRCGHISKSNRVGNLFHCVKCGAVEDAGANAGFNIAFLFREGIPRFNIDRDVLKASTDTARRATL